MRVLINNGQGFLDYTRYVVDGTLTIEDSINVPTLVNFVLAPTDNSFVVPKRSAYVRVVSEVYASGSWSGSGYGSGGYGGGGYGGSLFTGGGFGRGKVLATGFISNQPEVEYLGMSPRLPATGYQQVAYHVNVTSDEWLLNCKALPYIPAFVGQTQGSILASLAQTLLPNYFDVTTFVQAGDIVPYFQYTPDQSWADIAKTFGDSSRFRFKVLDKVIYFLPFGDQPLGISYDETGKQINIYPEKLTTNVVTVPPVNDAIVLGDVEPQTNWENSFIGDGFTANFPLLHNVFDGSTALLLEDDWTETGFQNNVWFVNDPLHVFSVQGQGLQVAMSTLTGAMNSEYIIGLNGLELGGGLNIQHGEVLFTDRCVSGIVGGLYSGAPSGTYIGGVPAGGYPPGVYGSPGPGGQSNCIAGFLVTGQASGASVVASSPVIAPFGTGLVTVAFTVQQNGSTNPFLNALLQGQILTPTGFSTSSFLNGQPLVFDHLGSTSTVGANTFIQVICITPNLGGMVYSGSDTGAIALLANTVVVSASGAGGPVIQPVFNGQAVGPQIIARMNHTYLLQTWLGVTKWDRYQAIYRTLIGAGQYGGNFLTASGAITWAITDFDQGVFANTPAYLQNAVVPQITKYTLQGQSLPAFAVYAPINAVGLNLVIRPNGTIISQPPEGSLFVKALTGATEVGLQYATTLVNGGINLINQPPTGAFNFQLPVLPQNLGPEFHYLLGFGQQNQTATVQSTGDVQQLAFYANTIPGVGARIRHQSWESGQSIARVQDPVAIATEAATSGDDGLRTAVMSNLRPLPRTSQECQLAGAAAIKDREYPQLQGTYTVETDPRKFENLFNPGTGDYPYSGRYFFINSVVRGITSGIQNFITNTVRIQVTELREEVLNISIDYGPDQYLEKMLVVFQERTNSTTQNLLTPKETAKPPNPIFLPQVGTTFLPMLDNATIISIQNSAVTGNSVTVDLGAPPVTACEVRRIDFGWGNNDNNRVGLFTTQRFNLSRILRDQTWYLRAINGGVISQSSKALRVVYPFIPSPPSFISLNASNLQLGYNGFVSDIYGVEIRVPGLSGGPYQVSVPFNYNLPNTGTDSIGLFSRSVQNQIAAPQSVTLQPNALALYGPTSYSLGSNPGVNGRGVALATLSQVRPIDPIDPPGGGGGQPNPPIRPPNPPATIPPPVVGFPAANVPTQFLPGDIALLVSPNDASFEGLVVVSQAGTGSFFNGNWGFAWYDEQPAVRTVGGSSELVGDALLYRRGPSCPIVGINAVSGTDGQGNTVTTITLTSPQTVPFGVGDNIIVGIGYDVHGVVESTVQAAASGFDIPLSGVVPGWINPASAVTTTSYASVVVPAPPTGGGGIASGVLGVDSFGFNVPASVVVNSLSVSINAFANPVNPSDYLLVYAILPGGSFQGPHTYFIGKIQITSTAPAPYSITADSHIFDNIGGLSASMANDPRFTIAFYNAGSSQSSPTTTMYVNNVKVQLQSQSQFFGGGAVPYVVSSDVNTEATLYDQAVVTALPTAYSFSFNRLGAVTAPSVTGVSGFQADGYAAQLPPGSQDGVLFQRPVFSPGDLAFDLTPPYVQAMLQIAQAIAPSGRAPGLTAYFFNLTWDYSEPLVIPNVSVPTISGLTVNPDTQALQWSVLGGQPSGYRIDMIDPATGITQFRTTIDHSHNFQKLTSYRLDAADYFNNRMIVVTPFDEQGDGQPFTIFSPAAPGGSTGQATYSIGCTFNGLLPPSYQLLRIPLDQDITFSTNFNGCQGFLETPPTNTMVLPITRQPYLSVTQTLVGTMTFPAGSNYAAFAGNGVNFLIGDVLRVIAPSGSDSAGSNIGFVLSATKTLV